MIAATFYFSRARRSLHTSTSRFFARISVYVAGCLALPIEQPAYQALALPQRLSSYWRVCLQYYSLSISRAR